MSNARTSNLRASQVTVILISILVLLLCALAGGSFYAGSQILSQSKDVTHAQIDADVRANDPSRLQALQDYLKKNADGVSQTAALTAGLGQYNQDSIIRAINGYAAKAGVNVTSFDFATNTPGAAGAATPAAGNTVNVTLGSPIQYKNFIVFLKLLENGLMPAQVLSGQISGNQEDPGSITVSPLSIKVGL